MSYNPIPPSDWESSLFQKKKEEEGKPTEPWQPTQPQLQPPYGNVDTGYFPPQPQTGSTPGFLPPMNPAYVPSSIPSHSYSQYAPSSMYPSFPPQYQPSYDTTQPCFTAPPSAYNPQSYMPQPSESLYPNMYPPPPFQPIQTPFSSSGPIDENIETSKDQTPQFHEIYKTACSPNGVNQLAANVKDFDVFMVGGLNSEKHPKYMQCHLDFLNSLGINAKKVPIDTNASMEHNAKSIYDYISSHSSPNRKAILLGHSKGGNDVLGSLALYPKIQELLEGVVCLQTPFGGSSIGKEIVNSKTVKQLLSSTLSKLKIDSSTLENLIRSDRQTFFKEHDLNHVYVPLINLMTTNSSKSSLLYPLTEFFKKKYGLDNDGLISSKDAFIPNAYTITVDGVDHSGTMIEDEEAKGIGNIIKPTILVLVLLVIVVLLARAYRKRHRSI